MPYPRTHSLLTIGGSAWTGQEIWQFGLRFDTAVVPTAAEAAITAAVELWFGTFNPSQYVSLTHWKWALIGVSGEYPPGHIPLEHTYVPAIAGGITNGNSLPQDSIVMSLRTALPRGRGHAGRCYMPTRPVAVNGLGQITLTAPLRDPFVALIQSVQNAVHAPAVVGSTLAGTLRPVTAIRTGKVVDTQRRRRNNIPEAYEESPVTIPSTTEISGPEGGGAPQEWWYPNNRPIGPSGQFRTKAGCIDAPQTWFTIWLPGGQGQLFRACSADLKTMRVDPTPMTAAEVQAENFPAAWTHFGPSLQADEQAAEVEHGEPVEATSDDAQA